VCALAQALAATTLHRIGLFVGLFSRMVPKRERREMTGKLE